MCLRGGEADTGKNRGTSVSLVDVMAASLARRANLIGPASSVEGLNTN